MPSSTSTPAPGANTPPICSRWPARCAWPRPPRSSWSSTWRGRGWVMSRDEGLRLTAEGERLAIEVIRAHRLWERYLADEARMPLAAIHAEAERREHQRARQARFRRWTRPWATPPPTRMATPSPRPMGQLVRPRHSAADRLAAEYAGPHCPPGRRAARSFQPNRGRRAAAGPDRAVVEADAERLVAFGWRAGYSLWRRSWPRMSSSCRMGQRSARRRTTR